MLTIIKAFLGPWLVYIEAAAAVLVVAFVAWLWADRASLKADNAVYVSNAAIDHAALTSATTALAELKKAHAREMDAMVADAKADRARADRTVHDLEMIRHASTDEDTRPGGAGAALDSAAGILLQRAAGRGAGNQGGTGRDARAAAGTH